MHICIKQATTVLPSPSLPFIYREVLLTTAKTAEHDACKQLRLEVFTKEQPFDRAIEVDEYDSQFPRDDVLHLYAYDDDDKDGSDAPSSATACGSGSDKDKDGRSDGRKGARVALGTVRLIRKTEPSSPSSGEEVVVVVAKLGRLAVSKHARGQQLGRRLITAAEEACRHQWGASVMKVSSQHQVQQFYEKCGYTMDEERGYYDEEGWRHCLVTKAL